MSLRIHPRRTMASIAALALFSAGLTACGSSGSGKTEMTLLAGGNDTISTEFANALAEAFEAKNPTIDVKVETRPGGADGDNLIKTRLSTGEMNDVFFYNSGSLFQALHPDNTLQPLTDEAWVAGLTDSFKATVSTEKGVYGAPNGATFFGGILYNRKVYEQLNLEVPKTWDEFMSNNAKVKAANLTPVITSYGTTWTSQLFVLADFANVQAATPTWADDYTNNKAKYAQEPALNGFKYVQEIFDNDLMNKDYASLTSENAIKSLAEGKGAHYPMLANSLSTIMQSNPEQVNDIGYFAIPNASGDPRATKWEANGAYIPKSTSGAELDAAKKFVAFLNSPEGCEIQSTVTVPTGPFSTSACTLPADVPQLVKDELAYQDADKAGLALEFLSPIKGPNLEKILIQVGSGISTAEEGAGLYDKDVTAQAQQLGLDAWK